MSESNWASDLIWSGLQNFKQIFLAPIFHRQHPNLGLNARIIFSGHANAGGYITSLAELLSPPFTGVWPPMRNLGNTNYTWLNPYVSHLAKVYWIKFEWTQNTYTHSIHNVDDMDTILTCFTIKVEVLARL